MWVLYRQDDNGNIFTMREYQSEQQALPCPDWIKKRNREIQQAIIEAIEKEVEAAEVELKALEEKETKREAVKVRLAQLQKALPHG